MNSIARAASSIVWVLLPVLGSVATPLVCPVLPVCPVLVVPPWLPWWADVVGCGAGVCDDVAGPVLSPVDGVAVGPAPWVRTAWRPGP